MDWKKYSYAHCNVSVVTLELKSITEPKGQRSTPDHNLHSDLQYHSTIQKNHPEMLRTIAFNPIFEASVLTVAKRNSDIPIRAEDPTIA